MNPINATGAAGVRDIMAMRQQIIDRSQLLQQINTNGPQQVEGGGNPGGGFADTLRTALDKVNDVQGHSEAMSEAYQRGEVTDIAQVMLARQESSLAFEATLQVRNRLLTAYSDIMRMGV
jgi:flagellar hook-basal body complex protein FliE